VAILAARATFPYNERATVAEGYCERYCRHIAARVIAAHTIAMEIWAALREKYALPYQPCLEAAYAVCGLAPDAVQRIDR
jgi:hypothetical protein